MSGKRPTWPTHCRSVSLTPGENIEIASWAKPPGYRLTTKLGNVSTSRWQACEFDFTPQADGTVMLELMGTQGEPTTWTCHDAFHVEGAAFANGDFEAGAAKGVPTGWQRRLGTPKLVEDPKLATSGTHCVKVSHDHRFCQTLTVKEGQKVTVRFQARAALP